MYSQWLSDPNNEQGALQAGGYGSAGGAAPQQTMSAPASAQVVQPVQQQQQSAPAQTPAQQRGNDVWSGLGQIAAMRSSGGGGYQSAPELRPSAFGGQGSDAPQVANPPPRMGKAAKIAQIVQAVMTYGASKAATQEPSDNQGSHPTSQASASQSTEGSGSSAAQGAGAPSVGTGMGSAQNYGGGVQPGEDWKEYG